MFNGKIHKKVKSVSEISVASRQRKLQGAQAVEQDQEAYSNEENIILFYLSIM